MIFDAILVIALFAACLLVTIIYGIIAPWHRSLTGRALMTLLGCMTILTGLSALTGLLGEFPYWHLFARIAYGLMIAAVLGLGAVMIRAQTRSRRDD